MHFFHSAFNHEAYSETLFSILQESASSREAYPKLLQVAISAVNADSGTLVIKEGEQLAVKEYLGRENFSFRLKEVLPFVYWVLRRKIWVSREQILSDSIWAPVKKAGIAFFAQFQADLCLPLWVREGLYGFITLGSRTPKGYSRGTLKNLNWLSGQMALVLQNLELRTELQQSRLQIDAFQELKHQMLANLSHELRTPLTGVIGFAELLKEEVDGPLNPVQRSHVQSVIQGGNKLLKILSTLFDLAQLESGHVFLNVQQFPVAPLVNNLIAEGGFKSPARLEVQLNGSQPCIYGDLELVKQIFRHLLENAVKYTPQGTITLSANKKGEMLEICVADTGIGIEEEKLEKIFEGFYQANGSLTRSFEGAGLGLAVTKKLVQLHGGRLWVRSQPGRGSKFYFTLPLKPISIRHKELAA